MSVPAELSVVEIALKVRRRELSAESVIQDCLKRIAGRNRELNAFLHVDEEGALSAARAVDAAVAAGQDPGPLAGVPTALKDNIHAERLPTSCASKILVGYRAPFDATVSERLRRAGAVIVGKTNLDEFAMGSSTENSAFGPTRNPRDLERVPGGSSGGSAAAVAAGLVPLAFGSDTGGSIRQPAAFCGIVGLKPSYGAVSRFGLVAFASSLDQIGPLARSADDAAAAFRVVAGKDPRDSTSRDFPLLPAQSGVKGLKIGLPKEYFQEGLDPAVEARVREGVAALASAGAEIREISLPHTRYALSAYYLIAPCEASANLARFDGIRFGPRLKGLGGLRGIYEKSRGEGFGPEVKRRIMLGTYALSAGYYDAYYRRAERARERIRGDFESAFKEVDLIASPTAPTTAFRIGEKTSDPLAMYLSDVYTLSSSLAGLCGISVPCGLAGGLPAGLQLTADWGDEELLFAAARVLE